MFRFRGRIDRVDLSPDRQSGRVIDYKVGQLPDTMRPSRRSALMAGERLQLAIYRGALGVLPEFRAVAYVQGEYLHLQTKDGEVIPCAFEDGELSASAARLPALLATMGNLIEGGVFFHRTRGSVRTGGHCTFCEYLQVCGRDRVSREERKASDAAVREFEGMQSRDSEGGPDQ
ncbi:MAG: PD-(D/E)XK nuclease family protein [Acidobacteria bacterium]|nr:PD-(D/E)XK nuclease family protein [Acidobacteriota bacterium]